MLSYGLYNFHAMEHLVCGGYSSCVIFLPRYSVERLVVCKDALLSSVHIVASRGSFCSIEAPGDLVGRI